MNEEANKKALEAVADVLIEELKKQGSSDFLFLSIGRVGENECDIWSRARMSAIAGANMIAFALSRMSQEALDSALRTIFTHPLLKDRIELLAQGSPTTPTAKVEIDTPLSSEKKAWVN